MMIRKATARDIPAVAGIYERIHDAEGSGKITTGWLRGVYPTEATARSALEADDLFVLEEEGRIVAAARINRHQMPDYALVKWRYPARDDQVMVLHTLTVHPLHSCRGYGRAFLVF